MDSLFKPIRLNVGETTTLFLPKDGIYTRERLFVNDSEIYIATFEGDKLLAELSNFKGRNFDIEVYIDTPFEIEEIASGQMQLKTFTPLEDDLKIYLQRTC